MMEVVVNDRKDSEMSASVVQYDEIGNEIEAEEDERTFEESFAAFVENDFFQYELDQHSRLAGIVAESTDIPMGEKVRLLLDLRTDERATCQRIEHRIEARDRKKVAGGPRKVTRR